MGGGIASAVKNICCSSREPRFNSQHLHDGSQPFLTQISGNPVLPSDLLSHLPHAYIIPARQSHTIYICMTKPGMSAHTAT